MNLLSNGILLAQTAWKLAQGKKKWKKESTAYLEPYLSAVGTDHDQTLSTGIFHKLSDYPFEALFAANLMADLNRHGLTPLERKLICMAGAVLALGDVYCDDTNITPEKMHRMLDEPHQSVPVNSLDQLFLEIYKDLLIELDDEQQVLFHETLMKGFEAEKESRQLKNPDLPIEEVVRIIKNKGGISLLIYRSLMHATLTADEKEVLQQAGAFTQLMDDLFDLPWDIRKHTQTSATVCKTFTDIRKQLDEHFQTIVSALKKSALPEKTCKQFGFVFYIFKLGAEAYIRQLRTYCDETIRPEQILALNKEQLRFRHFAWPQLKYVLPRALRFNLATLIIVTTFVFGATCTFAQSKKILSTSQINYHQYPVAKLVDTLINGQPVPKKYVRLYRLH